MVLSFFRSCVVSTSRHHCLCNSLFLKAAYLWSYWSILAILLRLRLTGYWTKIWPIQRPQWDLFLAYSHSISKVFCGLVQDSFLTYLTAVQSKFVVSHNFVFLRTIRTLFQMYFGICLRSETFCWRIYCDSPWLCLRANSEAVLRLPFSSKTVVISLWHIIFWIFFGGFRWFWIDGLGSWNLFLPTHLW